MTVLVTCANGYGTSLMMKIMTERVLKDNNVYCSKIDNCSISEGKDLVFSYDLVMCPDVLLDTYSDLKNEGVKVIGLKNILSREEITSKLRAEGFIN